MEAEKKTNENNISFNSFLDYSNCKIIGEINRDGEYPKATATKEDGQEYEAIKIINWYLIEDLRNYIIQKLKDGKTELLLPYDRSKVSYKILKAISLPIIEEISTSDNTKTWLNILKIILDYKKKGYDFSDDLFNDFLQRIYEIEKLDGLKKFKFEGQNIIFIICKFNFYESVNFLRKIGFNFNDNLKYEEIKENKIHIIGAAHIAAKHYNLGALRALSDTSFNFSENIYFQVFDENRNLLNQDSALYQATLNNDAQMLNFLISSIGKETIQDLIENSYKESKTTSLLYLAAYYGNVEILKILIDLYDPDKGMRIKNEGQLIEHSPLAASIYQNNPEIASLLLPKCNINIALTQQDDSKTETYSALYLAIFIKNVELTKLILSYSPNQDEVKVIKYSDGNRNSISALEYATSIETSKGIIELLKRDLDKKSSICQIM